MANNDTRHGLERGALQAVTTALIEVQVGGYCYSVAQLAMFVSKSAKFLFANERHTDEQLQVQMACEADVLINLAARYSRPENNRKRED